MAEFRSINPMEETVHTLLLGRNGRQYLVTCIAVLALLLHGCAKPEKKDANPTLLIPPPFVVLSVVSAEKPNGPPKQTGPPPLLLPPSEELRSQMGRIRISGGKKQPELDFSKPFGAGEGAMKGAGLGLGQSLSGLGSGNPLIAAGMIIFSPAFIVVQAVQGVQKSYPEAKIKEFDKTFRTTIQKLNVPQTLRQHVADNIKSRKVSEVTEASDPTPLITLEIVIKEIKLSHDHWTKPHTFALAGTTCLLQSTNNKELYSHGFTTTGQDLPLAGCRTLGSDNSQCTDFRCFCVSAPP